MLSTILVALSLLSARGVIGASYKIKDVKDFIVFAANVNAKKNFKGTTVTLENDIVFTDEFSEYFGPVGPNASAQFRGTFDGQGYKISNLKMKTNNWVMGLFGISRGITIRNVVIDDTCSFTSVYKSSSTNSMGALIGKCLGDDENCIIENNVNMAPITFDGISSLYIADVFIGGLAGELVSYTFGTITNCANYGTVTHSGLSDLTYMGGLAGQAFEYEASNSFPIKNSVNYGAIVHSGTTTMDTFVIIGGLAGLSQRGVFENCANYGEIKSNTKSNQTGNMVGWPRGIKISNSYWNGKNPYGPVGAQYAQATVESAAFDVDTYKLEKAVTVGKYSGDSLLSALNAYVDANPATPYSHWVTNKGGNSVIFTVNGVNRLVLKAKLIVLPNLAKEGKKAFAGWYTDSACKNLLKEYEINSDKFLYGTFK